MLPYIDTFSVLFLLFFYLFLVTNSRPIWNENLSQFIDICHIDQPILCLFCVFSTNRLAFSYTATQDSFNKQKNYNNHWVNFSQTWNAFFLWLYDLAEWIKSISIIFFFFEHIDWLQVSNEAHFNGAIHRNPFEPPKKSVPRIEWIFEMHIEYYHPNDTMTMLCVYNITNTRQFMGRAGGGRGSWGNMKHFIRGMKMIIWIFCIL